MLLETKFIPFVFLISILQLLAACSDGQHKRQEAKYIEGYFLNVTKVLKTHAEAIAHAKGAADVSKQQTVSLKNLEKVKHEYSKYQEFTELQAVIKVVDFALSHLFQRNQQIFELAEPLWATGEEKFLLLKDSAYYTQHQQKLDDLTQMMVEYRGLLKDHNKDVRERLVASGLPSETRARIWPGLSAIISLYTSAVRPQINVIKTVAEREGQLAQFLFEHRENYQFDKESGLQFDSMGLATRYNSMLRSAVYWNNAARDRARQGF